MTLEEKLKEEAEDVVYGMGYDTYESDGHSDFAVEDILVKFTEPREKRITELEAQIEKMKCCGNCENRYGQEKCADCHNYSKWKFKQAKQFYEEIVE